VEALAAAQVEALAVVLAAAPVVAPVEDLAAAQEAF
jgi:hypothetical protein